MTSAQRNILNLFLFQVFWFACILGGNPVAAMALILYTFLYTRFVGNPLKQWKAIGAITLAGLSVDMVMARFGVINFAQPNHEALWLLVLWPGFATLFFHGLHWLRHLSLPVVAGIGAIAGPLTYWIGANLNESDIAVSLTAFIICYGIAWAVLLPLFAHLPHLIYAQKSM